MRTTRTGPGRPWRGGSLLLAAALLATAACTAGDRAGPGSTMAPEARTYLLSALDTMERHSLVRDEVDWPKLRRDALGRAEGATEPAGTYEAIEQALRELGDGHSTFLTPEEAEQAEDEAPDDQVLPEARQLPEGLGRLTLPPIRSDTAAGPYLRAARAAVREVDRAGACGWVVDLRTNTGGDMWTPLASAGPILGDGEVGAFVEADGTRTPWTIENGTPRQYADRWGSGEPPARPRPPVAVLTGPRTASAGEAVAIAFRGRPDTRTFGEPTFGVPTANTPYPLADGALVVLTTAREADRTGRVHDGPLRPDVEVEWVRGSDRVLAAATDWLAAHDRCRKP
ncbi:MULTISPECIES: S41 family peptidase [Streptomyces]|uniref:Peptidase S41 n=2 Tax=Streptomyces TaxID=1883 RepID=A0A8G1ZN73_9ACTN|nr:MULTISPECIES: S41 family peptidase [Streptomyces]KUL62185.1 peptidase S41 [Streptomyces albidoflavus]MBV7254007.1 peptidase S41 [Streptomyces sp. S-2]MEE1725243.1 S41 family peptidase [Streptomyces sp. JV186]RZE19059.1 peptidase S41 [Streptomyces albidoflavus]RZE51061.1 peptidase S41 [Streptomyces albidoflavus]